MAAFVAFGDDSGSHAQSPIMVLAAVVAEEETWKKFSDRWSDILINNDKPLRAVNGEVYFRSTDAEALVGCFKGFTREQADAKVEALTDVVLDSIIYGMLSAVKWEHFINVFQAAVPKPKGRLHNYCKHPYYLLFHDVTSSVCNMQLELDRQGKIGFVFDRQGKMLTRSIEMYKEGNLLFEQTSETRAERLFLAIVKSYSHCKQRI